MGWYLHNVIRSGLQREEKRESRRGEERESKTGRKEEAIREDSGNGDRTQLGQGYKKTIRKNNDR